jgi:hypothetical protein
MNAYREAWATEVVQMAAALDQALEPHGFVQRPGSTVDGVHVHSFYVRKTWNTNRAVVLAEARTECSVQALAQTTHRIKLEVAKVVGYFPFLYGVGLQVVWLGAVNLREADDLGRFVDTVDDQRAVLQSFFCVDLRSKRMQQGRTWGQVVTGKFQDAIDRTIVSFLASDVSLNG